MSYFTYGNPARHSPHTPSPPALTSTPTCSLAFQWHHDLTNGVLVEDLTLQRALHERQCGALSCNRARWAGWPTGRLRQLGFDHFRCSKDGKLVQPTCICTSVSVHLLLELRASAATCICFYVHLFSKHQCQCQHQHQRQGDLRENKVLEHRDGHAAQSALSLRANEWER